MVSQDVEDSLSKRFFKWLFFSVISFAIVLGIIFSKSNKQTSFEISLFVVLLLITLVTFLIAIFNLVVWLKIKSAIRTYHQGNYDKAKDIAISAYKLSNYREINDLIDYIDTQIIDEKISQQERLEQQSQETSDYLQDIVDLIEDIQLRIKRLQKIKQEIEQKLSDLQKGQENITSEVRSQYFDLINQYSDLSRFTDYKINVYTEILQKLQNLLERHQKQDHIIREQEDLKDIQEKILSEGYTLQEDDDEEISEIIRKEKIFIEYVKEFLASTMSLENTDEFTRIYKEFNEQLEDLNLEFN